MLRFLLKNLIILCALGTIMLAAVTLYIVPKLPAIDSLLDVRMQIPLRIYSQDNRSLIAEYGEKKRIPVAIKDTPQRLIDAFIAAEDERFYAHPGVDWRGLMRATISLLITGEKKQGGSTITMQVARNFFLSREKSYLRKLNEIFLALKIESQLQKDQILELYLNKIYLGQRAYGIGAAAQVYYGTAITDLNLAQYAMIAGLPKAPSRTNPVTNPEAAKQRRTYVLGRMLKAGFISPQDYETALQAPLSASLHGPHVELEAPYVAEMVRKQLTEQYGDKAYTDGYLVTTTLRDTHQQAANHALRSALLAYDKRHGYRGAEQHHALDRASTEADWAAWLQPYSSIGPLYPAVVTQVNAQAASAYLAGIGSVAIEWSGLRWARRYIDENRRGPAPATAADVVKIGDIIRVTEDDAGNWLLSQLPQVEGGLVSLDPNTGATLALVGGFDFYRSKFNRIVQAKRQPGSSFKPFIYSAALDNGFSAASIINDAPVVFNDPGIGQKWRPKNYSGKSFGPTLLREALRKSRNLVSIRLLDQLGIQKALEHIEKYGFQRGRLPQNLSLALGSGEVTPWQLARGYAVLANGGYAVNPYFIEQIIDHQGNAVFKAQPEAVCPACEEAAEADMTVETPVDGATDMTVETPVEATTDTTATATGPVQPSHARRVVDARTIWIMHSLLKDVVRSGTGRAAYARLKRNDLAGKTGTTNDQHDAWFAGFNSELVAVAWVGFDKFLPLGRGEVGGKAALPMWTEYMQIALDDTPEAVMERPVGLLNVRIDPKSGCKASTNYPGAKFEVFKPDQLASLPACEKLSTPAFQF